MAIRGWFTHFIFTLHAALCSRETSVVLRRAKRKGEKGRDDKKRGRKSEERGASIFPRKRKRKERKGEMNKREG